MYSVRSKNTIKIFDGWAGPSVVIRCETEEWADRMNELVAQLIKAAGHEVWEVKS